MTLEAKLGITKHINHLLKHRTLVPCQSPWNTLLLSIKMTRANGCHPVQDLREVNKWVEDNHPTVPKLIPFLAPFPQSSKFTHF